MSAPKTKVVVSDFHLGAGHRNLDGSLNILEDFFHDREFIEFLQFLSSGSYEASEVELVINGDFFNLLMIDFEEIDPDIVTELSALRRMTRILEGHKAVMNALKYFQSHENKSVVFIMGNHDPGIVFASVQTLIRQYIGDKTRFYLESYEFDGIHIEHGNQYEPANAFDRRAYLISDGIPEPVLNQPWGSQFYVNFINRIKRRKPHFDKVLPFWTYVKWTLLYDFKFGIRLIAQMIGFFIKTRFMKDPRRSTSFRQTLRILFGTSTTSPISPDLGDAAERILMTRDDIHTVIFGHNHRPTYRQFYVGKNYVNTGTWNAMTHLDLERLGTAIFCTFALIEYVGLRPHTSLKVWKGRRKLATEVDLS